MGEATPNGAQHKAETARAQRSALVRGETTAMALLDSTLDQIAAVNPSLNAVITLAEDRARTEAEHGCEELLRRRAPRGAGRWEGGGGAWWWPWWEAASWKGVSLVSCCV